MKDLFETPEVLPENVKAIIDKFNQSENDYNECQNLVSELESVGYTCDFGLDAVPFNLRKLPNHE